MDKSKWSTEKPLYIDEKDDRYKNQMEQLKEFGFSDSETWSLFSVVAEFILPRLKRLKEIKGGYPANLTNAEWDEILNKMIFAFEWSLTDGNMTDEYMAMTDEERDDSWEKYKEGMELFAEYFMGLWW